MHLFAMQGGGVGAQLVPGPAAVAAGADGPGAPKKRRRSCGGGLWTRAMAAAANNCTHDMELVSQAFLAVESRAALTESVVAKGRELVAKLEKRLEALSKRVLDDPERELMQEVSVKLQVQQLLNTIMGGFLDLKERCRTMTTGQIAEKIANQKMMMARETISYYEENCRLPFWIGEESTL